MKSFLALIDLLLSMASRINGHFTVEDLPDEEMQLKEFRFAIPNAALGISKGEEVAVVQWNGLNANTLCFHDGNRGVQLSIEKHLLEPKLELQSGLRKYRVGLGGQRATVLKSIEEVADQQKKLLDWEAVEDQYTSDKELWLDEFNNRSLELLRRVTILENRQAHMSRLLVQETMYNIFDPLILKWVEYYNSAFTPSQNLDPNILKSMIFQETKMGTSGRHLTLPPLLWTDPNRTPIRSRFNLGQAIDSAGNQQYLMIKEMAPSIYSGKGLNVLENNNDWAAMTNDQYDKWNGGNFILALKDFFVYRDQNGNNLMGVHNIDLSNDYEFWIRTAVRWLFYKYESLSSSNWRAAVKGYNGGGSKATSYRNAVMRRVGTSTDLNVGSN